MSGQHLVYRPTDRYTNQPTDSCKTICPLFQGGHKYLDPSRIAKGIVSTIVQTFYLHVTWFWIMTILTMAAPHCSSPYSHRRLNPNPSFTFFKSSGSNILTTFPSTCMQTLVAFCKVRKQFNLVRSSTTDHKQGFSRLSVNHEQKFRK